MLALLAALAFLIGLFVSHPNIDTWQFWFVIGLVLWAAHFAFTYSVSRHPVRRE